MQSITRTWTTNDLAVPDRYDAWAEMLNNTYGHWKVNKPDNLNFFGTINHYNDGTLKVVDCTCDPFSATRTRSCIMADSNENLTIQVVLKGCEDIDFNGENITLKRGDILLWDSTKPMAFCVKEQLHKISVVIPLERFQSWLPRSWSSIRHSVSGHSNSGHMLVNHIKSLTKTAFQGGCEDNYALIDATIGILVNALGMENINDLKPLRVIQLHNVKKYIMANIRDHSLSPAKIAKDCGMSLRYLHWLFKPTCESVTQYIYHKRLDLCTRDLINPHMSSRKLTDIALFWGFQDVTHFNKRFKQRYGVPPGRFSKNHMIQHDDIIASDDPENNINH